MTDRIEQLAGEIAKVRALLAEAKANYDSDPSSYSARLLLLSTENYLGDLLRELELEKLK